MVTQPVVFHSYGDSRKDEVVFPIIGRNKVIIEHSFGFCTCVTNTAVSLRSQMSNIYDATCNFDNYTNMFHEERPKFGPVKVFFHNGLFSKIVICNNYSEPGCCFQFLTLALFYLYLKFFKIVVFGDLVCSFVFVSVHFSCSICSDLSLSQLRQSPLDFLEIHSNLLQL